MAWSDDRVLAAVCCSVAAVSTGVASWALYKWCKLRKDVLARTQNKYSTETEIRKQLVHHYVNIENLQQLRELIPESADNYPIRIARLCSDMCDKYSCNKFRVLDVGSGVGGISFHLSKHFLEVIGADTSFDMLIASEQMKRYAEKVSPLSSEGGKHLKMYKMKVPDECERERVKFLDQDVCSLLSNSGSFDCILVSNVLTDLESPKMFLQSVGGCVADGAIMIISDPFLWPEGPEAKLGGEGVQLTSTLITSILKHDWIAKESMTMPFYVAQSEHVVNVCNAQVTVWQKITECAPEQ